MVVLVLEKDIMKVFFFVIIQENVVLCLHRSLSFIVPIMVSHGKHRRPLDQLDFSHRIRYERMCPIITLP